MEKSQLIEKLRDHRFYLENFCKIKTKDKGIVPFNLKEVQKDLFNAIRKHSRIMVLKARQLGLSTAISGYFYVHTITNPGTTTALIGYNADLVSELLDKIKTFWKSTPEEFRPKIHYNSKHEISFPNIDSKILVLPSTENVGRGYTLNCCLCTELAQWEKAEEKMMSIEASVPINGKLIIESTPHGTGNLFHRMWVVENDYEKKKYGWWWGYSKEEIAIIKRRINNPRIFAQEFGLEFLTSGRPVFDPDSLLHQRQNILEVGNEYKGALVKISNDLRIYREPEADGLYVCGADVSEGVEGGDYSVASFWDRRNGEEVAFYRGMIAPDKLGVKLNEWGRKYNNALMTVEANNHGIATLSTLRQLIYPTLYFRPAKFDTLSSNITDRIGWRTNRVTRFLLIDELNQVVRDGALIVHSKEILDEMSVYVYNINNDMVAQEGFHDDTIFSAGIAFQGFKILYSGSLEQLDYYNHLPKSYSY